jgi:hypothetical protein
MPPKKIREIKVHEFEIESLPISCGFLIVAPPGSGKSTLAENLLYYRRHIFPVAKVFIGTEDDYDKLKKIFPSLYVNYGYDEDQLKEFVKRQKSQALKYPKGSMERRAALWFDDVSDDLSIWKTKDISALVKLGSRHWDLFALWCTQAAKDFPPQFRSSVSYVALGRNTEIEDRKKLFTLYGSVCGNQRKFDDFMDQIARDHTFLIIKKRSDSNLLEECVFWYQTKILPPWTFGCPEYRQWADARYNKNYQEELYT